MSDENKDEAPEEVLDLEIEDDEDELPDEVEEEPEPSGLKAKLAKNKLVVIIVLFVLIIGGAVAGMYFTGMLTAKKPHEMSMVLPDEPVFVDIAKITVDLRPSPKHPRPFIRLVMQAELQGESAKTAFVDREAKILDAIQSHLRTLTVDELQDAAGTQRLRTDLVLIIDNIIKPERAITVYYKEIMIR